MSEPNTSGAEMARPSNKPILGLALVSLLNLSATGFVAWRALHPPPPPEAPAHAGHAEPPKDPGRWTGPTAPLDTFIVNLNEPGSTRYLKTTVALEVSTADVVAEVEKSKAAIHDELLRYLSSLSVNDTLGEGGKEQIQEQMAQRADKLLGGGRVRRLYFNEFVVQ